MRNNFDHVAADQAAFDQARKALESLGDGADSKDRLAAVRAYSGLCEAVHGKLTIVEHRYPDRLPLPGEESPATSQG